MSDQDDVEVKPYGGSRVSKGASQGKGLEVLEKAITDSFGVFAGDEDER